MKSRSLKSDGDVRIFNQKLENSSFSACAVKMWPKIDKCPPVAKISVPERTEEIGVAGSKEGCINVEFVGLHITRVVVKASTTAGATLYSLQVAMHRNRHIF